MLLKVLGFQGHHKTSQDSLYLGDRYVNVTQLKKLLSLL